MAESHRDEFVAVADEWNRYSEAYGSDGIRLFLVAIEAGRIGDSAPGFRFRLVAGPNEWKSETATKPRPHSEADLLRAEERHEFWSGLEKVMREKGDLSWSPSARRVHSYITVVKRGPFYFQFAVKVDSCRVEVFIDSFDHQKNDELFDSLVRHRESIHRGLDATLIWENKPRIRSCRIYRFPDRSGGYRSPVPERQAGYQILAESMYRFHDTLMPYVERLI